MGAPGIPDFNEYRFIEGETRQVIEKHNLQMGALNTFAEGLVNYVKEQGEALLVAGGAIFPTTAAGMAAAPDDGYFYAENPDPNISKTLYQRLSETEYRKVADDPSNGFVSGVAAAQNAAIEKVSKNSGSVFHTDDEERPAMSFISRDRKTLLAWDRSGNQLIPARKGFHTSDDPFFFGLTDKNRVPLIAVDANRQPIVPLVKSFYTSDDQPAYAQVDKNGVIFKGLDPQGREIIGAGGVSFLADSENGATDGNLYVGLGTVKRRRDYSSKFFSDMPLAALPNSSAVYAHFDGLMSENPSYITRELLAADSIGNPIYAYEFAPPELVNPSTQYPLPPGATALPSIVIVGHTHGGEKTGAFVGHQLADDLCNNWQTNKIARLFRFGVKVIFVPCLNPGGCDADTRHNPNGVDINRNGTTEWGQGSGSTTPGSYFYQGPAPGSEIETQVAMDLPTTYPGAFLYIDLHNHSRLDANNYASWTGARGSKERVALGKIARDMTGYIRSEFNYLSDEVQTPINRVSDMDGGFISLHWVIAHDAPGIYFESVTTLGNTFDQLRKDALRFNYENFNQTIKFFYEQHMTEILGAL